MILPNSVHLLRPVILSHNSSGLGDIDIADPTKSLEVLVGPVKLSQRDKIDLYWGSNGDPVATYTHSDSGDTNGVFSLYVDTHWIEPGLINVRYALTPFPSEITEHSEITQVTVKLAIPGGRDPNPATFYENENLALPIVSPPELITEPDNVMVTVQPYENMSLGDRIALSWHGNFLYKTIVSPEELGQPVLIPVPREIIELAGDSDMLEVRYEIRDQVNNWSRWSFPTYVEVEAGESALAAPVAPQAPNMELDLEKLAGSPVQVLVLPNPSIAKGDVVTLTVERNTAEGLPLESYSAIAVVVNPASFVDFSVPNLQFLPIAQGRARLKYQVTKSSGEKYRSKSLQLTIVGQPMALAPPRIPAAEANNGILDPSSINVITQVPAYYFMADGHSVNLVWMGKSASGANVMHEENKNLSAGDIGKPLQYVIPDEKVSALAGGWLEVYYTITTFEKEFFKSPVFQVSVGDDTQVYLPAPSVDGVGSEGVLDPGTIVLEALVRIAPYQSMAIADRVTLHWDSRDSAGSYSDYTVLNSGTVSSQVIFRVGKSYVEASVNNDVAVWYEVQRASQTFISNQFRFKVGAVVLPDLPAPVVKEALGDTLDPAAAVQGATFVVDASAHLGVGDKITAYWNGPRGSDERVHVIDTPNAGGPLELIFPYALVTINDGQTVELSYSVTRISGVVQESDTVALRILSAMLELPAPTMDTVGSDGILRPSLVPDSGATVRVSYPNSRAGDRVTVRWTGATVEETPPQTVGSDSTLTFNVSKAAISASEGSSATVSYSVEREGVARESEQLALTVSVGLELDTTPVELNGKIYLFVNYPDLLPGFPSGTTVKRVPRGGQQPYTYASSDPKIAHVDAEGFVSVRGRGHADITVADASGDNKSYQVAVTGVIECHNLGTGTWPQMSGKAASIQGRLGNIQEVIEIYNAYKGRWPLQRGYWWSSTLAKTVFGAKWYYAKDMHTGVDYTYLHANLAQGLALR